MFENVRTKDSRDDYTSTSLAGAHRSNGKSRVAQDVRDELDDLVESFEETGCLRVEAFLDLWNNRDIALCPDCQSEHCSDSKPST